MSLAEQIEIAKRAIDGWPDDVRAALGIEPLNVATVKNARIAQLEREAADRSEYVSHLEKCVAYLVPCSRCNGTGKLQPHKLEGDTDWRVSDCPEPHAKITAEAVAAYANAMNEHGVPRQPLAVYDSNSYRRVGLASEYRVVVARRESQHD